MSDKSETFSPFDAADYLATFDDVAVTFAPTSMSAAIPTTTHG